MRHVGAVRFERGPEFLLGGDEALSWQKRFLDHFLKDTDNGMDQVPAVRLEARKAFYQQEVRFEQSWPLPSAQPTMLYLSANDGTLQAQPVGSESKVEYASTDRRGKAVFSRRFEEAVELVGSMRLKLWVSTSEGDDLDLFVALAKLDAEGSEVYFSGFNGYERDGVAKGWLRVSHRELDPLRSTPLRPWHTHKGARTLHSGEAVSVEIEIWPSATLFETGSTLRVTVQGHDAASYPAFRHRRLANRGRHCIFTGGQYDSRLTVPLNKNASISPPSTGH